MENSVGVVRFLGVFKSLVLVRIGGCVGTCVCVCVWGGGVDRELADSGSGDVVTRPEHTEREAKNSGAQH